MKKYLTSEGFKEAYIALRMAAIILLVLATLFITIKGCAFQFDCEFSIPDRMEQERSCNERDQERAERESYDRCLRDDNPSERDYERAHDYERDRMA
jgi:hypothetical protein